MLKIKEKQRDSLTCMCIFLNKNLPRFINKKSCDNVYFKNKECSLIQRNTKKNKNSNLKICFSKSMTFSL